MSFVTADQISQTSDRNLFGNNDFWPEWRLQRLRDLIEAGLNPRRQKKWNYIAGRSLDYVPLGPLQPWYIPENYGATPDEADERGEALHKIETDYATAADLALRYKLALPSETVPPELIAKKVVEILDTWTSITNIEQNAGSMLNWNETVGVYLQAAMMVKESPFYTDEVDGRIRDLVTRMYARLSTRNGNFRVTSTSTADNNWAAWGICAMMAIACFLGDRKMFDGAIFRWRQQFDYSIKSNFLGVDGLYHDNVPIWEVYRQGGTYGDGSYGLLYSNHDFNAKIIAAEWARLNGEYLYDYVSPDGSSVQGLWETLVQQNRYINSTTNWYNTSNPPVRFTFARIMAYVPILNEMWGNADSQWLVDFRDIGTGSGSASVDLDFDGMRSADLLYRP